MLKLFDTVLAFSVVMLLLSLIVTAIVQAVSAVLDLRGKNLIKAVTLLLEQADPDSSLKGHAQQIAEALCKHPAVATGNWRTTAKALRSHEVVKLLDALATHGIQLDSGVRAELKAALEQTVTKERLAVIEKAAREAVALFPTQADAVQQAFERATQAAVKAAADDTRKLVQGVEAWFDTVMDRSSEWFLHRMRYWTIGVSVVLAVLLQVDTLGLVHQISSNDAVRAVLVERADPSLKLGDEVLGARPAERTRKALMQAHPEEAEPLDRALGKVATCTEGTALLRKASEPAVNALSDDFRQRCAEAAQDDLAELRARVDRAAELLQVKDLRVYNAAGPLTGAFWREYTNWRVLLGTLLTAILLSLGAPFWFNALRQMSNLRPMIAGKVEQPAPSAKA